MFICRQSLRRRANARNVSFRISLRWPIHIINPVVDKTKLSCNTPTDAAPQFLWKLTPIIRLLLICSLLKKCYYYLVNLREANRRQVLMESKVREQRVLGGVWLVLARVDSFHRKMLYLV